MKITMYELFKLIKDGKAPKKIKVRNEIYEYKSNIENDFIDYIGIEKETNIKFYLSSYIGNNYLSDVFTHKEIEIIEEPQTIEKITVREKTLGFPNGEWTARNMDKAFAIKINELIDEINNLKEK